MLMAAQVAMLDIGPVFIEVFLLKPQIQK